MSTYFITGGAGFLGINLTRYLIEKGNTVISYDLSKEYDYPEKNLSSVTVLNGDIRNFDMLNNAMKGSDVVIHTAAALPLYSKEDIFTTDVCGSKNVLEAAKQNSISRVVMISSTAVYGIPDHHPIYEYDQLVGVGAYGKAKIEAEKVCCEYREKGMCVPIVRPKSFIGPERLGVFALFFDWARDGKGFPMIGKGNNRYQLLDVYDLCEAIYLCATLDMEIANDTFNIGAEVFTTMKKDYQAVLDMAGFGKKIKGFPAMPMIWALRLLELLHLSPIYKWVYETASKDSFVSIEKAKAQLGYMPIYSNKEALCRNYKWYIDNFDAIKATSGVSHRVQWKQGILKLAKMFF
ncbi:MAG: NAD(P)-dependent oxidoreductase [Clostridia bacterium]|nr:NAD(P)-dependent oxidoreductase [Clostridia bacterium]